MSPFSRNRMHSTRTPRMHSRGGTHLKRRARFTTQKTLRRAARGCRCHKHVTPPCIRVTWHQRMTCARPRHRSVWRSGIQAMDLCTLTSRSVPCLPLPPVLSRRARHLYCTSPLNPSPPRPPRCTFISYWSRCAATLSPRSVWPTCLPPTPRSLQMRTRCTHLPSSAGAAVAKEIFAARLGQLASQDIGPEGGRGEEGGGGGR